MLEVVVKTISRYNMLPQGARVIVAVSGGADSVCLLHALKALAPETLTGVAHLNHQLRGEASDEDEQFVAALAHMSGVPFYCLRQPIADAGDNLEQAGHRARKRFFQSLRTAGKCDLVAVGHTRDDQAETVLFRFLRGSGLAGLSGIAPAANGIIRPLIEMTREQTREFLQSQKITWREDATNLDPRFARNRIRHDLLPQLIRDWNPRMAETLAKSGTLARDEEDYWTVEIDRLAARELIRYDNGIELRFGALAALPIAVGRRLIRRAISEAKGDLRRIDFDHVESILALRTKVHLPGVTVTRSFDWLRFVTLNPSPLPQSVAIAAPGLYPSPDGRAKICVEVAQPSDPLSRSATLELEVCSFSAPLQLRGWRPGDHYRPYGKFRDRKIQEMFQKARVPSWRRASWPILTSGDKILWSRQFGVAWEAQSFLRVNEIALS